MSNDEINIHDLPKIKMQVYFHNRNHYTNRKFKEGVNCYVYDMENNTINVYASIKMIAENLGIKYQVIRKHLKKKDYSILNGRYQIQYRYMHIPIWKNRNGSLFVVEHIYGA